MGFYHFGAYLSVITRKVQIEESVQLGENISLSGKGGIIIGAESIGDNCIIQENVTIGWGFGSGREAERPILGDNVLVEANSLVYGNIKVGDGSVIRKGTVLTKSVPGRCVVQGNPGKVVERDFDNSSLVFSLCTADNT